MQSIIFSAVLDAVEALKARVEGRAQHHAARLQAIHPNVTFADLPKELQDAIAESVRTAFTQLLKEGYAVGPTQQMQAVAADGPRARARPPRRRPASDRRAARAGRRAIPTRPGPDRRRPGPGPGGGPRRKPQGQAAARLNSSRALAAKRRRVVFDRQ